ncbi:MAG: cation transporter [Actinobacteria bacterium]|nr:cation transporter [Actinomycetota bacterium]
MTDVADGAEVTAPPGHGTGVVIVAVVLDLAVGAAAGVAWSVTDARSCLAVAVAAAALAVGRLAILLGGRRVRRTPDDDHPFHHGRERYFWAFVLAVAAAGAAAAVAIGLGAARIDDGTAPTEPEIAAAVLAGAAVVQVVALLVLRAAADRVRGEVALRRFVRRGRSPELPVALVGAAAAPIASIVAAGSVGALVATDDPTWDGVGAVGVGAVLLILAFALVAEAKTLLLAESGSTKDLEAVHAAIAIEPTVIRVVQLRAVRLGPEDLLVGARVELVAELEPGEAATVVDRIERSIRSAVPAATEIFLAHDVDRPRRDEDPFVVDHVGHIDPDDPDYATITGSVPVVDDDIWS